MHPEPNRAAEKPNVLKQVPKKIDPVKAKLALQTHPIRVFLLMVISTPWKNMFDPCTWVRGTAGGGSRQVPCSGNCVDDAVACAGENIAWRYQAYQGE